MKSILSRVKFNKKHMTVMIALSVLACVTNIITTNIAAKLTTRFAAIFVRRYSTWFRTFQLPRLISSAANSFFAVIRTSCYQLKLIKREIFILTLHTLKEAQRLCPFYAPDRILVYVISSAMSSRSSMIFHSSNDRRYNSQVIIPIKKREQPHKVPEHTNRR